MDTHGLLEAARAWLADDPDEATRSELEALLAAEDVDALQSRFAAPLAFGTAGIRGALGAGPARMNRVVVRRVSAGLARRLVEEQRDGLVVVGRDARHGSADFAADASGVLAGAGLAVRSFDGPVPTPLVAFAVRHLDAAGGVVVTASHNPPADNGYKVYWAGGSQIVPPLDAEIAAAAEAVERTADLPVAPDRVTPMDPSLREAYVEACLGLVGGPADRGLRIVYTPLHGVAREVLLDVLDRAGFRRVRVVPEQSEPDPDFPTVAFPNPEEPGAMDLALALATDVDADLVLANDPDGDRIAVAIPDGSGGWRALNGDEIGCLLAEDLLARGYGPRTVATTVVSSQLLARIADRHGAAYAETLTGFKWLAAAAEEADAAGRPMVLAYEQALGVMCGGAVRDKDGISAALVVADLAARRAAAGSSIAEALDELAVTYGLHLTAGRSTRLEGPDGPALVEKVLSTLREDPPTEVEGVAVVAFEDRAARVRRHADGTAEPLSTPPQDLVGLLLADGSRLQVRPSGTEPLLKFYAEVVEPVADRDVIAARDRAERRLDRLADTFVARSLRS